MLIELKNLEKSYQSPGGILVRPVNCVSLKIPSNQIFGIIGKSGAGKSTLVRLVSLLEKPDSGEVLYDGERVDTLSGRALIERRRRIGMIFQNFNLFSSRNAEENIAYPLEICRVPKQKIRERTKELLELVGLSDRAKSPVSQLSGGQKQRIAIARALANNPDILFCDEATSALDPQTTTSILNLIREIQKKMNLTVVMITHQMEVVRDACSQVAVVDDGRIVEQGSAEELFCNPKSAVTVEFLRRLTISDPASDSDGARRSGGFVQWSEPVSENSYLLFFHGEKTDRPVLSELASKFKIEFNIRGGGTQKIQEKKVGVLAVDFFGEISEIKKAVEYLVQTGVQVEKK